MKIAVALSTIMLIASQSYAGLPGFNRGRPSPLNPVVTEQRAEVKLYGADLALFNHANVGVAIVDKANDKLKLELYNDSCHKFFPAPGMITCAAEPELLHTYEVRLEKISDGPCGEIIYEGSVNLMPVDGPAYDLKISDNRDFGRHCMSIRAVSATTGSLKVQAIRGSVGKQLTFEGRELK